jgi:hypothetical protein
LPSDRATTSRTRGNLGRIGRLLLLAAGLTALIIATAAGRMQSTKVDRHLCETKHGGKFVDIPGFPGEKIDRRLLADVDWLVRKYDIFITDGYALHGHARNGEHPIGLALDIVPDKAAGGRWRKVTKLARWAEPEQDRPRTPFRWVGYDGDDGHGRGHHLHLSWMHSETEPGNPARVVYTRHCPKKGWRDQGDGRPDEGSNDGTPDESPLTPEGPAAESPLEGGVGANDSYTGDGGIGARQLARLRAIGPQHD